MSQQINLYDDALERQRDWLTAGYVALAVATLLVCVGTWGTWDRVRAAGLETVSTSIAASLKGLRDQAASLEAQVQTLKPNPQLADELARARQEVENRKAVLAILKKGLGPEATSFAEYLRGLARQGGGDPWLTGFSVDADSNAMEIRGRTLDPSTLANYIKRLNGEKVFQGQTFSALQVKTAAAEPAPSGQAASGQAPAPAAAAPTPVFSEFILVPVKPASTAAEKRP